MKTNHRRGFVAESPGTLKVRYGVSYGVYALMSDKRIASSYGGFGGDRYNRRNKAGAKKFVRSRFRFHEKQALQKLVKEITDYGDLSSEKELLA
jgi:catalase